MAQYCVIIVTHYCIDSIKFLQTPDPHPKNPHFEGGGAMLIPYPSNSGTIDNNIMIWVR